MDHTHHTIVNGEQVQLTAAPCQKNSEDEKLHVVACINNYVRFKRRYELFWKFKHEIEKNPDVVLYIVEIAFGKRPYMVTQKGNPRHLQLRTNDELWHKENSINLMVQRFPTNWKYVAWIDADIKFVNPNWAAETIHQLQHYHIVQLFQNMANLGPNEEILSTFKGFMYQYLQGKQYTTAKYEFWHPGFAWAATKDAWNRMGGLIDFAILGAGDHHMALAWVGMAEKSLPHGISDGYRKAIMQYQVRCENNIKRDVGYVSGCVLHYFHGSFKNRKYVERWKVLTDNGYNPDTDIKRDWQGLITFDGDKIGLRDGIRQYFRLRHEDSIDVD